jgi:hypothetical protein
VADTRLNVPGSDDTVVLVDYMGGPNAVRDLFRLTPDGSEIWPAQPPDAGARRVDDCPHRGSSGRRILVVVLRPLRIWHSATPSLRLRV